MTAGKRCIISFDDQTIVSAFKERGFECIPVIRSNRVSSPISCHSDVLYNRISSDTVIVSACQQENITHLAEQGFTVVPYDKIGPGYKDECRLNFILTDKVLIGNPGTMIEEDIIDPIISGKDIDRIPVRQGYTRCSTIVLNDEAFITSDTGILNALREKQKDCYFIDNSSIHLEGYDRGFIGGSSCMIRPDCLLMFGDISDRSVKESLIRYCNVYGVTVEFIEGKELNDIGSALIL